MRLQTNLFLTELAQRSANLRRLTSIFESERLHRPALLEPQLLTGHTLFG